jgi:hypothetical protein
MIPVKQIRVGPFVYAVKPLPKDEAARTYGMHDGDLLEISLRDKFASPAQAAETTIHEVLHALYQTMGLNDKDNEERTVGQLACGLAMVIRDNPALIKWIVASLK